MYLQAPARAEYNKDGIFMQLAEFHYQILDYIEQHPYSSGPELKTVFPSKWMRIERALTLLSSQKFLLFTTATNDKIYEQHKDEEIPRMEALGFEFNWRFFLSETGHITLESHRKEMEEFRILKQEFQVVKDDSKTAKLSAYFSNGFALIAIIISIISLIRNCFLAP